ncbi:MAG TPA: hypothetical protein VF820_04175 [Patescibacteria group bacterium]
MKIIKIIGETISIIAMGLAILLFVSQTNAQELQQVTITPPKIEVTLNPGDKTEGRLGIINDSDTDMTFITGVYDFIVTDNNGTPQVLPRNTILNNKYSAANWIAVYPEEFTVKRHQRFDFNYYIQVPQDAGAGGHYAALIYQPVNQSGQPSVGAKIQTQIATLVYIDIKGTINESAKVTKFTAPNFSEYGPIKIQTEIKNFGDLHITPQATITVKDMLGRVVATAELPQGNIFPGGIARDYINTLGTKLMIGRFTATLLGSYGTGGNLPLSATLVFWVFPWRAATVIALVLIAIVLAFLLYRRRKNKHEDDLSSLDPHENAF